MSEYDVMLYKVCAIGYPYSQEAMVQIEAPSPSFLSDSFSPI
jgi:hypothetical protein